MSLNHPFDALAALSPVLAIGPLATGWIGTIVIGFLVGLVSKLIVGGREPAGCLITIIIGIVGSVVALLIGRALGWYAEGQAPGFIASVVGAIILLAIYHAITRRSGGGPTV
ncbi:MAG: GlsB/YeaQ/YmgE family stress response membrane protein [Gluconacetobacter diazotrophicus]|nr:GlsB/YeaQ/YmgE family stress response membrane protein [Gluconacetobacter diazotrophicus]